MADYRRSEALMDAPATAVYDDLGEQSVWRRLYRSAYELPAGYCTLKASELPAREWIHVHVLHDPHLIHNYHREGYAAAGMGARLQVCALGSLLSECLPARV